MTKEQAEAYMFEITFATTEYEPHLSVLGMSIVEVSGPCNSV